MNNHPYLDLPLRSEAEAATDIAKQAAAMSDAELALTLERPGASVALYHACLAERLNRAAVRIRLRAAGSIVGVWP